MRRICDEQLLLASSTTEGNRGGDVRNSEAPLELRDARIALERQATVISYGEAADAIVTTARRSRDAASADQVLVVFLKQDYTLKQTSGWDALGMRGTCSDGFKLVASGSREQILPVGYDEIHAQTMMPVAHLAWSGAWAGIAAAAVDRARAFVRHAMHRADATMPPGATHLTRASASLRMLRGLVAGSLQRFESVALDPVALESVDFQSGMNLLKVNASELAVKTVMSAMQACRTFRLPQRRRFQHRPPSARRHVIADHDQQRPHPRQCRHGVVVERRSGVAARLNIQKSFKNKARRRCMNVAFKEPKTGYPLARCAGRGAVAAVGHRRRLCAHSRLRGCR